MIEISLAYIYICYLYKLQSGDKTRLQTRNKYENARNTCNKYRATAYVVQGHCRHDTAALTAK